MRLKIRKMPQGKMVVHLIFWFSLFFDALVAEFRFPSAILYVNDLLMVFLIVLELRNSRIKKECSKADILGVYWLFIILFIYSLLTALGNVVKPTLVVWGARNLFRYILYFGFCIRYLEKEDIDRAFDLLFIVNIISFILVLYQHYALGLIQDYVGGIFGHGNGAALNPFQAMLLAFFFCKYLKKQSPLWKVVVIVATSFYSAAIAEEKAYFVYAIIVVAAAVLINKPSLKNGILIGLGAVGGIGAVEYMYEINPWLKDISSFDSLISYANSAYSISRINPFIQINDWFFDNNFLRCLFGFGFGSCEYSDGIRAFNSSFANQYSRLGYMGFIHQMRYLETGAIGVVLVILCFVGIVVYSLRQKKNAALEDRFYFDYCAVFAVVMIVSIWMSASIRNKEAFIFYYGLATAPVLVKHRKNNDSFSRGKK